MSAQRKSESFPQEWQHPSVEIQMKVDQPVCESFYEFLGETTEKIHKLLHKPGRLIVHLEKEGKDLSRVSLQVYGRKQKEYFVSSKSENYMKALHKSAQTLLHKLSAEKRNFLHGVCDGKRYRKG